MIDGHRHLDVSKGPGGAVKLPSFWFTNSGCCGAVIEAPFEKQSLFWYKLPFFFGDIVSSREVVSVISGLQV